MSDFPTISIVAAVMVLLPLVFTAIYARQLLFVVFAFCMFTLSIFGYLLTLGTPSQEIFSAFGLVSALGMFAAIILTLFYWSSKQIQEAFKRFGGY